jgi:hypothetical protein
LRATGAAAVIAETVASESGRIVQRPDGFHWIALDGRQEFGPFETLEQAEADMLGATDEDAPQPGEALQEAEREIGIAEWIDPETGEPAEGPCPPHLDEE